MMEMLKMASELQADPDTIKKYSPVLEKVLINWLISIPNGTWDGQVGLLMDNRNGRICLTIGSIDSDGHIHAQKKRWFTDLIDELKLSEVPAVVAELSEKPMEWESMCDQVLNRPVYLAPGQVLNRPKAKPVQTLDEFVNDEDQEFNRLARHFKSEFNDTQSTLRNLIAKNFDESFVEPMLNTMKLQANWSEEYYSRICRGLFYANEELIKQIQNEVDKMD